MLEKETLPELVRQKTPSDWVIWRFQMTPYFESITPEQVWMMGAVSQEKTFAEICEGLCKWLPEEQVADFAAGTLRNWIEKGMFSGIKMAEISERYSQQSALEKSR